LAREIQQHRQYSLMEGLCRDDPRTPLRDPTLWADAMPRRPALEHTILRHARP
jgi:hypothetical protein